MTRKWYIDEALHSFSRMMAVIGRMTEEEVLEALKLESETRRRPSIMARLIGRAARLKELEYVGHLKSIFNYRSDSYDAEKCSTDPRG